MLLIGKVGVIKSGDDAGYQVKVVDDSCVSGGFFILISKNFNDPNAEVFDSWVESYESLEGYFTESKWRINWL